jgi:outer membrane immunogenic protein
MQRSPIHRHHQAGNYRGACFVGMLLALAGPAQGADLGAAPFAKAPLPAASSWTGFYAGLGLGFRSTQADLTTTSVVRNGIALDFSQSVLTQPFDGIGFRANPYAGYNWQVAPYWLLGVEGDVGFGDRTTSLAGYRASPALGSSTFAADSLSVRPTWDASLRGRAGYLVTPATLLYATAGIAWQHYDVTSVCGSDGLCIGNGVTPAVVTNSVTRTGWTAGGGIETALWGNWLMRAEYRYGDFGTASLTMVRTANAGAALTIDNFDARMRTHAASFGVAYKFGDPVAAGGRGRPMDAQASIASWSGAYVGLGLGARATRNDLIATSESVAGFAVDLAGRANGRPFDGTAFRISPYVGYLWQVAPRWVAGIEGDAGFADRTVTRGGFTNVTLADSQARGESTAIRTRWDASLRGRLGYLVTPATLAYATGGVAWQHLELNSTCVSAFCQFLGYAPAVIDRSTTKAGWTLGGGIETSLGGRWLARAEYRYADYGTSSFTVARRAGNDPGRDPTVNTYDVAQRAHLASFGVTYRFD